MLKLFWGKIEEVLVFLRGLLSESDGSPSSARLLMVVFSVFTVCTVSKIVNRLLTISDPNLLVIFFNALPGYIAACVTLIGCPYAINKSAGVAHRIADIFAKRQPTEVLSKLEDVAQKILPKSKEKK